MWQVPRCHGVAGEAEAIILAPVLAPMLAPLSLVWRPPTPTPRVEMHALGRPPDSLGGKERPTGLPSRFASPSSVVDGAAANLGGRGIAGFAQGAVAGAGLALFVTEDDEVRDEVI